MPTPAADRSAGFTLLELLIALVIASLLFVFVLPTGSRQREHVELANAARTVAEALRTTRIQAINAGAAAVFAVDVAHARYRPAGGAVQELPRGIRVGLVTTRDDTHGPVLGDIRFFPDGSSSGGDVTLSRGNDRFEVLVSWLTGGVSIHESAATGD